VIDRAAAWLACTVKDDHRPFVRHDGAYR